MAATPEALDTHHKALSINLDPTIFGSFAEIGAGQEVARWFLKVGAASGTVAKTVSAYDKEVSDDIYGVGSRYVSQQRLEAMLNFEWNQLLVQLEKSRGAKTCFFSFVNTVAARNFAGTNYSHGWVGLRFRAEPEGAVNDVILHISLLDQTNLQQQDAVGILGVNLLYAAFHERSDPATFLRGLAQFVAPDRMEIDFIELRGPVFDRDPQWDDKAVHARLVLENMTEGVVFPVAGKLMAPADAFHKKAIVLAPGRFEHVEPFHAEMLCNGVEALAAEKENTGNEILGLYCISSADHSKDVVDDVLCHVEQLRGFGYGSILIRDRELFRMSAFVKRFTDLPVRFVTGISLLVRVFTDSYENTAGGRLEGIARLFAQDVHMYAYPMPSAALQDWLVKHSVTGWQWTSANGWVSADDLLPSSAIKHLYQYVQASGMIIPLHNPAPQQASSPVTNAG